MIILFNLIFFILSFFKFILYKNEFSFVRALYKKLLGKLYIIFNMFSSYTSFSFNKLGKIHKSISLVFNKKGLKTFKKKIYAYYLLNNLKTKWFIINTLLMKKKKDMSSKFFFKMQSSKLNKFLRKNKKTNETGFQKNFDSSYLVKYKPSSFVKYVKKENNHNILFLRKNKIFNKGRYSRNRQLYRTGVY